MQELAQKMEQVVLLPLRDLVVFPKMVATLYVGREKSLAGLKEMPVEQPNIFVVTQKQVECDYP